MATMPLWPPEVLNWLLFSLILVAERLMPLPRHLHPLHGFRALARGMAAKVHPSLQRPRSQQRISGLMALLLLTLPWLVIAAVLYGLTQLNWLFAALVLFFCLYSNAPAREYQRIRHAHQHQQKLLARERLQPLVARQTRTLSSIGIAKAAIEWYSRTLTTGWLGVLLWFVIAGPIAALAYRLLLELAGCWPVTRRHWRDFGALSSALAQLASWPAYTLQWLLFAVRSLLGGKVLPWSFAAQPWITAADGRLWRAVAMRLQCRLGGPVILDGQKRPRPRFQFGEEPQPHQLQRAAHVVLLTQIAWWLILSPLFLLGAISF